ncbi:MAG: sensor histidine kinase [Myxococcaceae bacterium]
MHDLDCTKRELEKLADLRELFIAALAHDLRAPLSVILLSEAMLRGKTHPLQSMEVERHIDRVQRSARRMLQLIDSLLLAARVESGESRMTAESLEAVLVDEVAREVAADLSPLADEALVRLEVTTHEPIEVLGNRAWLGQVFANLLTNAIRHSPAGTRVEVAVVAVDGPAVRCEVTDQGPGVPVAARGRIFDRFVQHGERPGSIGLGLYISSKIVALHGGRIWVEEAPSGGARFVFQIPRASRPQAS